MLPHLENLKTARDWDWLNTPVGVILTYFYAPTGEDDTAVCVTSQRVDGWWVLPDGSWTQKSPAIPPATPGGES